MDQGNYALQAYSSNITHYVDLQDLQKDFPLGSGNPAALPGNFAEKTKTFAEKLKQTKVTSKMQVHNNYSANERYGIDSIERKGKVEYIKNGRPNTE